jgi:hypothetical protein
VADLTCNCSDTPRARPTRGLGYEVTRTVRVHAVFMAIVLVYVVGAWLTARAFHIADRLSINLYSAVHVQLVMVYLGVIVVWYSLRIMIWRRPERPLRYARGDLTMNWRRYFPTERLCNGLLLFLVLPPFMSAFGSFKVMIPAINPFSWDACFARLDPMIHGGRHPWQLLQPVLGYPPVTSGVNFFYHLWFFVMFGVFFWQAVSLRNPRLRMQYLLTFQLSWILLGTVAAIAFSSGGPCYYGRLVSGPDIYEPLMKYLWSAKESYPLWALDIQEELWVAYQNKTVAPLRGITAMPSMHVSSAFLFALVGCRTNRYIGIPLTVVAILVGLGCVHLGWHYAVDAYAAILGTWLIWWAVGRLQRVASPTVAVR